MLYQLHDLHLAAWTPARWLADGVQRAFTHPAMPISYTHFGRAVAAGCELLQRATHRYHRPDFGIDRVETDGKAVAVREVPVLQKDFCVLTRFEREGVKRQPKLLIVAPLSGHFPTLLRGTVAALLPDHDVYITDWMDAREVPLSHGPFDLDDYIDYMIEFIEALGPDVHVMAVCQPVVPVLAAISIMAAEGSRRQPRSMILMGGPIDPRCNPTEVNKLATSRPLEWFDRTVITRLPPYYPGAFRRVYPGFLQLSGFMSMNLDRHVGAHIKLFQHLVEGDGDSAEAHRRFYNEYQSVMDLPAEYYLQTIKTVFQDQALPKGEMTSRGRPVDPAAIRKTALMTIEGELDDISGRGQTAAAHDLCTGIPQRRRRHHLQPGVGHYGVFNGRRFREEIVPEIRAFVRRFDSALPF